MITALKARNQLLRKRAKCWLDSYSPDGSVEYVFEVLLGQGRAFHVFPGPNILGALRSLFVGDGRHSVRRELLNRHRIVPHVELGAHKYDRNTRRMVVDFGVPLCMGGQMLRYSYILSEASELTLATTLSNDGGLTREKQIRKTSVWGYDSGRSLS